MSQAKVDKYKESKKHRKQEVKKQRRSQMLARILVPIACAAVVVWIGYSGYSYYQAQQPIQEYQLDSSPISDYLSAIQS